MTNLLFLNAFSTNDIGCMLFIRQTHYAHHLKRTLAIIILACSFPIVSTAQTPGEITLPSATGDSKFVLSEHRGEFVALHFLLKTECPVCLRHTWDYSEKAATLPGVVQVFIKPDSEEEIRGWLEDLPEDRKLSFPIYRDADAALAEAFEIPDGYHFHNQVVHYPALVLIGPGGKEVFRYVGKDNSDRYSFEQLESKINELSEK